MDGYNVVCILMFLQYQWKGYGCFLIQFLYEFFKIEGKFGLLEKLFLDLGLLSYCQYWLENIIDLLFGFSERDEKCIIEIIVQYFVMMVIDVEYIFQVLKMQVYYKGEYKIVLLDKLVEQWVKSRVK